MTKILNLASLYQVKIISLKFCLCTSSGRTCSSRSENVIFFLFLSAIVLPIVVLASSTTVQLPLKSGAVKATYIS